MADKPTDTQKPPIGIRIGSALTKYVHAAVTL